MSPEIHARLANRSLSAQHLKAAVYYCQNRAHIDLPAYQAGILDQVLIDGVRLEKMERMRGWPNRSAKAIVGVILTSIFSPRTVPEPAAAPAPDDLLAMIDHLTAAPDQSVGDIMQELGCTATAARVMFLLRQNAGRPMTKEHMIAQLYPGADGPPVGGGVGALKVHIFRLRRALDSRDTGETITTLVGYGYRLDRGPAPVFSPRTVPEPEAAPAPDDLLAMIDYLTAAPGQGVRDIMQELGCSTTAARIMFLLRQNPGRPMSKENLLLRLYHSADGPPLGGEHALTVYISRLRRALASGDTGETIATLAHYGYRLDRNTAPAPLAGPKHIEERA